MGMFTINTNIKVWPNRCDCLFSSTMSNSRPSFDSWAPPFSLPNSPVLILPFRSALFLSIPPYSAFLTATSLHHHLQFPEHLPSHSLNLLYWFFLLTLLCSSQFCCTLLFQLPHHHVTICSSPSTSLLTPQLSCIDSSFLPCSIPLNSAVLRFFDCHITMSLIAVPLTMLHLSCSLLMSIDGTLMTHQWLLVAPYRSQVSTFLSHHPNNCYC